MIPFPPPASDPAQRAALAAADRDLKPITVTGEGFAVNLLEWTLQQAPNVVETRPVLPSEAADELREVAAAIIKLRERLQRLSGVARAEADWFPLPAQLAAVLDIDNALIEDAKRAAARLDGRKHGGNPKGRKQYPLAVAIVRAELGKASEDRVWGLLAHRIKIPKAALREQANGVRLAMRREERLQQQLPKGVTFDDFWAYLPEHKYIYVPTRQPWPAASVNAALPAIDIGDEELAPNVWLDSNKPVAQMTWLPGAEMLIANRTMAAGSSIPA